MQTAPIEQKSSVTDLSTYRSRKRIRIQKDDTEHSEGEAVRAIEEIAHYLLMAARVIKKLHQDH